MYEKVLLFLYVCYIDFNVIYFHADTDPVSVFFDPLFISL